MCRPILVVMAVCCHAALIGHYKLAESQGGDLYDYSGYGNNAVVDSGGGLSFIVTDRGYYLNTTTSIEFPNNKYSMNPGSSEMIIGFWHKPLASGFLMTFNLKSANSNTLIQLKFLFLFDNTFNLEFYQDNLLKSQNKISAPPGKVYVDSWRLSIIYLKELSGSTTFTYYRRLFATPEFEYTFPSLSIADENISWSIGSKTGGVKMFVYEIYWYDLLEQTIYDMFFPLVSEYTQNPNTNPCYQFPKSSSSCMSDQVDPYKTSDGIACNDACKLNSKSCSGSSSTCISFVCDSNCITGCYILSNPTCICIGNCKSCYNDAFNTKVCSECAVGYAILPISQEYSCVLECPLQYYKDSSNIQSICKKCGDYCNTCSEASICTECMDNYFLLDSICVEDCGVYYYKDTTHPSSCRRCGDYCNTCLDDSLCIECNSNYYLSEGFCVEDCEVGYYKDGLECRRCLSNCDICPNSYECDECDEGLNYFLVGGEYNCSELCPVGYYLMNSQPSNRCVESCPSGYYQDEINQTCKECPDYCTECMISYKEFICSKCMQFAYILESVCKCYVKTQESNCPSICPEGMKVDKTLSSCTEVSKNESNDTELYTISSYATDASIGVATASSLIFGIDNGWDTMCTVQIFSFLGLMQAELSPMLQKGLKAQEGYLKSFNIFQYIQDDSIKPYKKAYDSRYQLSNIFVNSGKPLFYLFCIIFLNLIIEMLYRISKGKIKDLLNKVRIKFYYGVYSKYIILMYLELIVPTLLHLQYVIHIQPQEDTIFQLFSYIVACILSVMDI